MVRLSFEAFNISNVVSVSLEQLGLFAREPAILAAAAAICNVLRPSSSTNRQVVRMHLRAINNCTFCAALWLLGSPNGQQLQQGGVEATVYVQDQQTTPILIPLAEVHGGQGILLAADVRTSVLSAFPIVPELEWTAALASLVAIPYPVLTTMFLGCVYHSQHSSRTFPCLRLDNTFDDNLSAG